jgi:adenosylhomocysteine nucleosidase
MQTNPRTDDTASRETASREAGTDERPIGMVAAFHWEVKPLLRHRSPDSPGRPLSGAPYAELHALRLAGRPFLLAVAGAGAENSQHAAEHLAANYSLCGLVTLGFAGGLVEGLKVADVVLADRVVDQATQESFACDTDFLPVRFTRRGALLSAISVVATAAEKHRMGEQWHAVAVDMESAGVARAARRAGLPFGALKAISDSAEQTLSIDFDRCRSEDKSWSVWAVVCQAFRSFRGAGDLWRLAWNSRQAAGALAAALGSV